MSRALRSAVTLLIGSAIFLGLPLLGWGMTDAAGFLREPGRRAYVLAVILLNGYAAIRIPEVGKRRGHARKFVRRQRWAVVLLQVLTLCVVIVGPYSDRRDLGVVGNGEIARWAGLALYALGFLAMHWAEVALGKQFSLQVAIQEGHHLVTAGPYRYVRHPRYLGILVFAVGISLVFRSWIALMAGAATVPVVLWRIHDEEALMEEEFGAAWRAYTRQTWRLVPFAY